MAKFTKGKSGNPNGRPQGSKNKSYLDASHWLGLASEVAEGEKDPEKKMSIIRWASELIMQKVPQLPATPGESVANAVEAHLLLKSLEHAPDTDTARQGG